MDNDLSRLIDQIAAQGLANELLPSVQAALLNLADALVRQTPPGQHPQATALIDTALQRSSPAAPLADHIRLQLLGLAARALRTSLVTRARNRAPGRIEPEEPPTDVSTVSGIDSANLVDLDLALTEFEAIDPGRARIVELLYFGGLSTAQASEVLGITERNAERGFAAGRAWLHRRLREGGPASS